MRSPFNPTILCRWRLKFTHLSVTLCAVIFCLVFLTTDVVKRLESHRIIQTLSTGIKDSTQYLVDTSGCRIPRIDPLDQSVSQFINPYPPISCDFKPSFTFTEGMFLRINTSVLYEHYTHNLLHCEYQEIYRPSEGNDNVYLVNKTVVRFTGDILVSCEYIRVVCFDKKYTMIYTNFHTFIRPLKVSKSSMAGNRTLRPSVLMVGVDSVSRLNFLRQMPQTQQVLLEMGAFDLHGYNKVADNTLVNLIPMFTGNFLHNLQEDKFTDMDYFDDYKFVWKEFDKLGYRTLFGEDAPEISIFNYMRQGFRNKPMDYYLRPFSLAIEEYSSLWNNNHDCLRDIPETQLVLDWTKDFLNLYKSDPYFAFIFLTRLTHDNVNKAGAADTLYANFFKQLKQEGHLENTVLIFFSDHGMRFGPVREMYIGKLEERLPFLHLLIPDGFQKLHKSSMSNLGENQHRLTTPFDVYKTLLSLADDKKSDKPTTSNHQHGISLFSLIPGERTCDIAGIDPHWCTCHQPVAVDVMSPVIVQAALQITSFINVLLDVANDKCEKLVLEEIKDALYLWPGNIKDSPSVQSYLVTAILSPGNGLFEATLQYDSGTKEMVLQGEPSRINKYGDQGKCIKQHSLQKYCFCRE